MEVMILMTTYRQKYISNLVSTISSTSNILSFPIKINPVMRCAKKHCCNNLYFIKYTDFASSLGTSIEGAKLQLYSNDGRIMYDNSTNKTYIYYNDTHPKYRIRWNISHELGHLFLNHIHEKLKASKHNLNLSKLRLSEMEEEANYFAKMLIAPLPVVVQFLSYYKLNTFEGTYTILRSIFHLSQEASYYYALQMVKEQRIKFDIKTVEPFIPFITNFIKNYNYNAMNILKQKYIPEIPYVQKRILNKKLFLPTFTTNNTEKIDNILYNIFYKEALYS